MKKDIHPEYREVLFHDTSVDEYFLVRSTLNTDQTKEYKGKTYPYSVLDISSASHPFYTGKQKLVDTGGRVDKFRKIENLWPNLYAGGTTPEGLCYEAIMKDFVPSTSNRDSYFLNFSDGMPMFGDNNFDYYLLI